jgi:hypothetical protein
MRGSGDEATSSKTVKHSRGKPQKNLPGIINMEDTEDEDIV